MKKLILSVITILTTAAAAFADGDVTFEVAAPRAVNAGDLFRIEFVINDKPSEFISPVIEGFEVLAGPTESHGTSISIVNGDFSKTVTTTYTYVLQGFTPGVHTIPAASAVVKGKTYSTKPLSIEVVSGGTSNGGGSSQTGQGNGAQQQADAPKVAADDIFARVTVSRSEVYKGEPVVVALKLYSRVQFGLDDVKFPSFNGFWQQDISRQETPSQRETYNNRVYDTWTLKEYLLYPQQSGTLTIDPFDLNVVVRYQVQSKPRNIFDELMGGGANVQDVRKKLSSQPVKINVRDWPDGAPASFNGAVGQFTFETTPPAANMNANTSGTYVVKVSGTGNFPMIRPLRIEFPTSFEEYNVTTSENIKHTHAGTTGSRQYSYPFIPRMEGSYTIPELQFSYFDPRQARYITLSAREVSIEVAADSTAVSAGGGGMVSGLSKEDLKILGRDIRFIKLKSPNFKPKGSVFMWSPLYSALMALSLIAFAAGLIILRKYVRNMQNDRFVRGKRANKVALKRFRAAETSMKQGDKPGFYDEMLKALWGYISDKLDIPMASLTKDRIREELFERSIPEVQANEYVRIISDCEEAQYAPTSSAQMNELYKKGVNLVSDLESAIKR